VEEKNSKNQIEMI